MYLRRMGRHDAVLGVSTGGGGRVSKHGGVLPLEWGHPIMGKGISGVYPCGDGREGVLE